ncbi:MAG: Uncharacterised protein [Owenweeksia sp. TMED14]|nr:MAG: Uncharacterised protein [Owenweeksia sp. TMED14]
MRESIFFFFIFCVISISAQIVNVEAMRSLTGKDSGTHGIIDGRFYFGGVQNLLLRLSTSTNIRKTVGDESYYGIFSGNFSTRIGGESLLFEQNGFVHGRYNRKISQRLTVEGFFQWQSNKPMLIAQRYNFGFGPRYMAIKTKTGSLFVSPLIMYELDVESSGKFESVVRMSTYISLDMLLYEKYRWNSIAYYQPVLGRWDDVRVVINSRFSTPISPELNLVVSANVNYDAYPGGSDSPNFTYGVNSGLGWRF